VAESLFASLLHTLDKGTISQIASSLGQSEQGILRGVESSIACALAALTGKSKDPAGLRRMMDVVPDDAGEVSWSKLTSSLSSPGAPWITKGKQMLSSLFGANDGAIANAVGRESGVGAGTATTLLSMAVPMVIRSLRRRMQDEGLDTRDMGSLLERESATVRSALPAGVADLMWPARAPATAPSPVITQQVHPERRSSGLPWALGLAALALGAFWLWNHARRPAMEMTGEANRMAERMPTGDFIRRTLPNNVQITIPANGAEAQMFDFINDRATGTPSSWMGFDRVTFASGSSTLSPTSSAQINNVAAIMKAYPNANFALTGYTDNVGSDEQNLALSRARAESVKNELVARGVSPDRLTTYGAGEQGANGESPVTGNAQNRSVSMQVTQK
jgi:outer membrane protein OmpA-like peptidoglycan-associated protein